MKDFLLTYSLYRGIKRRHVAFSVYKYSPPIHRAALWIVSMALVASGITFLKIKNWETGFSLVLLLFVCWIFLFDKARKCLFSRIHRIFPEQMKFYSGQYQYLRYRIFHERLQSLNISRKNIESALKHLNDQIETEDSSQAASHPIITTLLAILLAVLGGAAGSWSGAVLAAVISTLLIILYFGYAILGITKTPRSQLREFKRFLLWTLEETAQPNPEIQRPAAGVR